MKRIVDSLDELVNSTKIKLRLVDSNNKELFDNLPISESKTSRKIKVNNGEYKIYLEKDDIKIVPLVEYILNKFDFEDSIIEDILNGKKQWGALTNSPINKSDKMLIIDSIKISEVLEIVQETYYDEDIYIERIDNRIIIVGNVEDEEEYAYSLKESILHNLGVNAKISISYLDKTFEGFKKGYSNAVQALSIGNKFNIKPEIYNFHKMYLENAIFNLDSNYSNELKRKYKDIFENFNYELIKTFEEIIRCNLSLTKAAKNLYLHRNTLMYRVEKIKKETGFDIRNFKEATFLYVIYLNNK